MRNRSAPIFLIVLCVLAALPLLGCAQATLRTDYDYVLLLQTDKLTLVDGEDQLYAQFERMISEPFTQELLDLYTATAKGLLVDQIPSHYAEALSRKPVFVLGAIEPGVHHKLPLQHDKDRVRIELATGLGGGAPLDLDLAEDNLPSVLAELMMVIMGVEQPERETCPAAIYEFTSPEQALWIGFGAALDAHYGRHHPERWPSLSDSALDETERERLMRYQEVPGNGLRYVYEDGQPTNLPRTYQEALCTPGVVASFFYRLWSEIGDTYKQSDMVWFANYDSTQIKGAKILLAFGRMSQRRPPSLETFVQSYCETFPAECAKVTSLMHDIVGAPDH